MNKLTAMATVVQDYGNHPCGPKFCRCGWIMIPPAYPTDYWDCTNAACGKSIPPTKNQTQMLNH